MNDITSDVYKTLIEVIYNDIKDKGIEKIKAIFDKSLSTYLSSEKLLNSNVKNFLFGNDPVEFRRIYTTPRVKIKNTTLTKPTAKNIYQLSNHVTLIGEAGIGKSTYVKYLFNDCLDSNDFLPILIELRTLSFSRGTSDLEPEELIRKKIFESAPEVTEETVKNILSSGKCAIFLDGFDEVASKDLSKINQFISILFKRYHKNFIVLTSRPHAGAEYAVNCTTCHLLNFNEEEISNFISNISYRFDSEFIINLKTAIQNAKKLPFHKLLSNPLLLILFISSFRSNPDVPSEISHFYSNVINALFSKHDGESKNSFPREVKSGLTREKVEKVLKCFSFLTQIKGEINFTREQAINHFEYIRQELDHSIEFDSDLFIKDMLVSFSLWIKEDAILKFTHRSFQEYFFCLYIASLTKESKEMFYNEFAILLNNPRNEFSNESFNILKLLSEIDLYDFSTLMLLPNNQKILEKLEKLKTTPTPASDFVSYFMHSTSLTSHNSSGESVGIDLTTHLKSSPLERTLHEFAIYIDMNHNAGSFHSNNHPLSLLFSYTRDKSKGQNDILNFNNQEHRKRFDQHILETNKDFLDRNIALFQEANTYFNKKVMNQKNTENLLKIFKRN